MTKPSITTVVRAETPARYVQCDDGLAAIPVAWRRLEAAVGSLRGRHFLGAFDPVEGWYRACVELADEAAAAELALPECVLPGGPYLRLRLRGDPPELYTRLPAAFELLASRAEWDPGRPSLERYRRVDRVDALLPVAQ
ncbi:MAG: AraC family transcriptional regulator [Actinomycetota bacterium]|nr:AraC family transcriptional regulator [Actinomycetota bacterium]